MKKRYLFVFLAIVLLNSCAKEPEACFEHEIVSGNKVNFDASCSIHAATYLWDFGDGGSSTISTPQHIYNTSGDYTVTLTVGTKGSKTASHTASVTVAASGNVALNTHFSGNYLNHETHAGQQVREYHVYVSPNPDRDSEAIFDGLGVTGGPVVAVIDLGATTFRIVQQTLQTDRYIVSTSGTINSDGSQINLSYRIEDASSGNVVDNCTAVLTR